MTTEEKLKNAEIENRMLRAEIGRLWKALDEADVFGDFGDVIDKAKRLEAGANS